MSRFDVLFRLWTKASAVAEKLPRPASNQGLRAERLALQQVQALRGHVPMIVLWRYLDQHEAEVAETFRVANLAALEGAWLEGYKAGLEAGHRQREAGNG